jgi:hypothetical protein
MHCQLAVLLIVGRALGHEHATAVVRTETPATLGFVGASKIERVRATLADRRPTATTRQRVACLRTPAPLAVHATCLAVCHCWHHSKFSPHCLPEVEHQASLALGA